MKRKKVNIMMGRFQPMTIGHLKCVKEAFIKTGCPTIFCMSDAPVDKLSEKKPFPTDMLLPIYQEILKGNKMIEDIIVVKSANIIPIGKELYENGYEIRSWSCGSDRVDAYTNMANKYRADAHLPDDFEVIEIQRNEADVSATKLRAALLVGDVKEFFRLFVPVKSNNLRKEIYNTLYKQIRIINNNTHESTTNNPEQINESVVLTYLVASYFTSSILSSKSFSGIGGFLAGLFKSKGKDSSDKKDKKSKKGKDEDNNDFMSTFFPGKKQKDSDDDNDDKKEKSEKTEAKPDPIAVFRASCQLMKYNIKDDDEKAKETRELYDDLLKSTNAGEDGKVPTDLESLQKRFKEVTGKDPKAYIEEKGITKLTQDEVDKALSEIKTNVNNTNPSKIVDANQEASSTGSEEKPSDDGKDGENNDGGNSSSGGGNTEGGKVFKNYKEFEDDYLKDYTKKGKIERAVKGGRSKGTPFWENPKTGARIYKDQLDDAWKEYQKNHPGAGKEGNPADTQNDSLQYKGDPKKFINESLGTYIKVLLGNRR